MPGLISANGVLGFLADEEPELKVFALQTLNDDIDTVWTEVAGSLSQIESLYEDPTFPERQLAALVLAKVYYHLQDYNESLTFALAAGDLFELDAPGEFEETIISRCIDQYIAVSSTRPNAVPQSSSHGGALPALSTSFSASMDGSAVISPTSPFSQTSLPSKSLLSRLSTDNAILDPTFQTNAKSARSNSITGDLPDQATRAALLRVIERLFEASLRQGRYRQVLGIAIEAKDLEVLRHVIRHASKDESRSRAKLAALGVADGPIGPVPAIAPFGGHGATEELMEYALSICMDLVQERSFRVEMLRLILDLLNEIPNPDYFAIARCVVHLNSDEQASRLLQTLVSSSPEFNSVAVVYQIAFDLYDSGTQEFLGKVIASLPADVSQPINSHDSNHGPPPLTSEDTIMPIHNGTISDESEPLLHDISTAPFSQDGDEVMTSRAAGVGEVSQNGHVGSAVGQVSTTVYKKLRSILDGSLTMKLNLEFLYRNNHTDIGILNKVRDSLESRSSIFHTAVSLCNGFMNQGTTNDKFFRDNLEWLGKAVNWSKFTATATLGVIHRGNLSQSRKLLEPYLPKTSSLSSGSPFSQGGALYAYGLIHANHGADALDFLNNHFTHAEDEVVLHGGALGLGIAGMATGADDVFQNLKMTMFTDSALNGEAVGLAMGLIMLGTGNVRALEDMIKYAHETNHEKSVRGLAVGMALIMYGRQDGADELSEGLLGDPDATLRYGGVLTVALAYCGTGSNKAVRKLLHIAVSDVSDDVRRIAVTSLGFILFRRPGSVPRMVELLSESYNPHVRYGSAMALGISCAGTGLNEAADLLEPMMKDPTDFVRQGALIALAMIMIQQNEVMNPRVASIRKTFRKIVGDRHEDALTKFGAALALGIIDAGGRNCTIGLQTQTGSLNMAGIVGMAVFIQYWYWFPFAHFLSLSFSPTSIVGLDQDLEIPDLRLHCAARPSLFDYLPEQEVKTEEGPAMIATAILSTTAQARRRAQKKERAARRESMDIDAPIATSLGNNGSKTEDGKSAAEGVEGGEGGEGSADTVSAAVPVATDAEGRKKPWEKEKVGYEMENMSRVLPGQIKYMSFPAGRYKPVKKPTGGPILLHDTRLDVEKTLMVEKLKKVVTERAPVIVAENHDAGPGGVPDGASSRPPVPQREIGDLEGIRTLSDLSNFLQGMARRQASGEAAPVAPDGNEQSAAEPETGVDTAVEEDGEDEDGEDDDEAVQPGAFEYHSDTEE